MKADLTRIDALISAVEKHLSMDTLMRTLASIRERDRFFTFPKFMEGAEHTASELRAAGCQAEVVKFPADGKTMFADFVMPLAWDAASALVEIVRPADCARTLGSRAEEPNTTVMWCGPTPKQGLTGRVVIWDNLTEEQRKAADLRGRFLYTRSKPASVRRIAVQRAALGVIGSYGFNRTEPEFRDCVCWNNAWSDLPSGWAMTASDKPLPGFCISPAKGDELETLAAQHPDLEVRAAADTRLYEGTLPAVSALLPGATDREVVMIGHQFEIGANDNASGCAAIVEAARCIGRMVRAGDLEPPTRSARFMTCSEMYSSIPFAVAHPELMRRTVAGLNLDMICPYKGFESPMDFYTNPDANASFTDDLLESILRRVFERNRSPWKWERHPNELSDNCWCDPYVGVPMSWLSWHGREFWHSSGDTVDRLVPDAIRDVTVASVAWLVFLLTAGPDEAAWLARTELESARERIDAESGDRRDYIVAREAARVRSIARLAPSAEIETAAAALDSCATGGRVAPAPGDEAATLVPVRRCMAPLTFNRVPEPERGLFTSPLWNQRLSCALYWADGRRSIREIERLVLHERGKLPKENLVEWFKFLARHGYVELKEGV